VLPANAGGRARARAPGETKKRERAPGGGLPGPPCGPPSWRFGPGL